MIDIEILAAQHRLWLNKHPDGLRLDLNGMSLNQLSFCNMVLTNADFTDSYFENCNFIGTHFNGAFLSGTEFVNCNFTDTSFICADLSGADFTGCDLRAADLTGADISNTVLYGVVGDVDRIKTIQTKEYIINYTDNIIQIDTNNYLIKEWFDFTDAQIYSIEGEVFVNWWKKWKPILKQIIEG